MELLAVEGAAIVTATQSALVEYAQSVDEFILRRRCETLSRLSKSLTSGTPEAWVKVPTSELLSMLKFDFLDVFVFSRNGGSRVESSG
jgi:hypothetical protein